MAVLKFGEDCRLKAILSVLILAVALQVFAGRPLLYWRLEQEVRADGASWATHIFGQISQERAGERQSSSRPLDRLAGALDAALRVGMLNMIVIEDEACNCAATIDETLVARGDRAVAGELNNLFGDTSAATAAPLEETTPASAAIIFRESDLPGEPRLAAEITFREAVNGTPYALTLVTDVTAEAARTRLLLMMALFILSATLAGAAAILVRGCRLSRRAIRLSEKQARFLAEHDPMTGLLNRFGFGARAEQMLASCAARQGKAFLFQIDADKFKDINDIHGHPTGDRVIKAIGQMLTGAFPEEALVGRLGGDEFAVLVPDEALGGPVGRFTETLPTGTDVMTDDGAKLIEVSTSMGMAVFPDDGETLGELMKASDLALYAVKAAGRNGLGAYHRDMKQALKRRHWELDGVREAIRHGRLVPYYQPLVSARTGRIESVEALARWIHPTYGVLTPDRFSHALQDPRVSTEITREMLPQIADDLRVWRSIGHDLTVGVNIGEADLKEPGFFDEIATALEERDLPPDALAIELTETALTRLNRDDARPMLTAFCETGCGIALDDFGTGASSITLLKDMPCTTIKIDQSFIRDLMHSESDLAIVRSLVRLSHDLGFKIVAEGVEERDQARLLRKLRVDYLQGYLYSRPLPAQKLTELMAWASPPRHEVDTRKADAAA